MAWPRNASPAGAPILGVGFRVSIRSGVADGFVLLPLGGSTGSRFLSRANDFAVLRNKLVGSP